MKSFFDCATPASSMLAPIEVLLRRICFDSVNSLLSSTGVYKALSFVMIIDKILL
jgi:hypothetical protein